MHETTAEQKESRSPEAPADIVIMFVLMRKENVRCPMCGTMNYDVDLDETGGWTKCRLCKAVTCSMEEWKKHTVSVPLLNEKQLVARSMIRK